MIIDEQRSKLSRDQLLDAMTQQGIGVGVHYMSLPEHRFYQQTFGWQPSEWPHAMRIGRNIVSLPLSAKLTSAEVGRIIQVVTDLLQ
jgi:dTDP-4-amino-4,6-dideoxygalactose transaminase